MLNTLLQVDYRSQSLKHNQAYHLSTTSLFSTVHILYHTTDPQDARHHQCQSHKLGEEDYFGHYVSVFRRYK